MDDAMKLNAIGVVIVMMVIFVFVRLPLVFASDKSAAHVRLEAIEENSQQTQKSKKFATKEEALKEFLNADDEGYLQHFLTKHGELKLVNNRGTYNYPTEVRLNEVTILKAQKNGVGHIQRFMVDLFKFPFQHSPGYNVGPGLEKIDRVILSEGIIMRESNQFILLDFTCDKPFVSERFGFNPDLDGQLELEEVEWGKNKSYIYINGDDQRFIYYTCDRVDMDYDYDGKRVAQKTKKSKKAKKSK